MYLLTKDSFTMENNANTAIELSNKHGAILHCLRTCDCGLLIAKNIVFHWVVKKVLIFRQRLDHIVASSVDNTSHYCPWKLFLCSPTYFMMGDDIRLIMHRKSGSSEKELDYGHSEWIFMSQLVFRDINSHTHIIFPQVSIHGTYRINVITVPIWR